MSKKKKKRSLIQKLPSMLCAIDVDGNHITIADARRAFRVASILSALDTRVGNALQNNGFRIMKNHPQLVKMLKLALKK